MILSEHAIVKNNHGVCIRSSCSDVGVVFEWLRRSFVRQRKDLDEFEIQQFRGRVR